MTVEIFVFCGWGYSNQFDIVSETHFCCDTIGREQWLEGLTRVNRLATKSEKEYRLSTKRGKNYRLTTKKI